MLGAVLFDFDGVIVDSEPLHFAAFAEVMTKRGVALEFASYTARYLGLTDRECLLRLIDDVARPDLDTELETLLAEKARAMSEKLARGVPPFPGLPSFVAAAADRVPLALVSGALRAEIDGVLRASGLDRHFPVVVSAEDVRAGKPDPEGYRLGWQRLREIVAPDLEPSACLVIEDSPKGIAAARAAGMRVVALTHTVAATALRGADRVYASYAAVDWQEIDELFAV